MAQPSIRTEPGFPTPSSASPTRPGAAATGWRLSEGTLAWAGAYLIVAAASFVLGFRFGLVAGGGIVLGVVAACNAALFSTLLLDAVRKGLQRHFRR